MFSGLGSIMAKWRSLLAEPIGWGATVLLFLLFWGSAWASAMLVQPLGNFNLTIFSEGMAILAFACFLFPTVRALLGKRIELGEPRVPLWLIVTVAETFILALGAFAVSVLVYMTAPEAGALGLGFWINPASRALLSVLLVGLYLWKMALVCGNRSVTLRRANSFVWRRRKAFVALYLATVIAEFAIGYGLSALVTSYSQMFISVAFIALGAVLTWLTVLLVAALYLDFIESDHPVESVFA